MRLFWRLTLHWMSQSFLKVPVSCWKVNTYSKWRFTGFCREGKRRNGKQVIRFYLWSCDSETGYTVLKNTFSIKTSILGDIRCNPLTTTTTGVVACQVGVTFLLQTSGIFARCLFPKWQSGRDTWLAFLEVISLIFWANVLGDHWSGQVSSGHRLYKVLYLPDCS